MTTKMNNWQLSDANANFQHVCEMFLVKGALVLGTLLTVQLSEEQIRRCRFRISLSTAGKWSLYTRLSALKSTSSPGFSRLEKWKNPPRTQASSWIFPISLTGDVTSEIAEDDWERGCQGTRFGRSLKKFPYLTTVGNSSAENTNIASKEFMTENLPIIAKMIRPATNPRQERKQRIFTINSRQKTCHKYVG